MRPRSRLASRSFSLKLTKRGRRALFVADSNPDISKVEAAGASLRLAFRVHLGNPMDWSLVTEEGAGSARPLERGSF